MTFFGHKDPPGIARIKERQKAEKCVTYYTVISNTNLEGANLMKTEDIQRWLDKCRVVTDAELANLGINERDALDNLVGHKGMETLLGLMLGTRQSLLVMLSRMPLATPEEAARASVTQGKIQGIDLLWSTLLELATPAQAGTSEGATS